MGWNGGRGKAPNGCPSPEGRWCWNQPDGIALGRGYRKEATMGFGRGILLWLLGVPLPIIILLALFWR